ncbi:MAG: DVU0298 family protein [Desulfotomaculales bacterium]
MPEIKRMGGSEKEAGREEIIACLRAGDLSRLQAAQRPLPLVRQLISLLYSADRLIHWRAVDALAGVVAGISAGDPGRGRDVLRRLFWALNDESGGNGRDLPEAIGAIIARRPDLYGDLASVLLSRLGDPALNRGLLWAAARIGGARPELVEDFLPEITSYLEDADPDLRAHSALALGSAGAKPEPQALERLLQDGARVSVYLDGELKETTVGEIARALWKRK